MKTVYLYILQDMGNDMISMTLKPLINISPTEVEDGEIVSNNPPTEAGYIIADTFEDIGQKCHNVVANYLNNKNFEI